MLVVHVHVRIWPERIGDFLAATVINARASLAEPGVLRFDVIQDQADPAHVVLVEVYRDDDASAAHKADAALRDLAGHGGRHDGRAARVCPLLGRVPGEQPGLGERLAVAVSFEFATAGRIMVGPGRVAGAAGPAGRARIPLSGGHRRRPGPP